MRYQLVDHPSLGDTRIAIAKMVKGEPTSYLHNDGGFYPLDPRTHRCPKAYAGRISASRDLVMQEGFRV